MADEILGGLKLPISADYSQLIKDWQQIQGQAQQAGQQIASSFNNAAGAGTDLNAVLSQELAAERAAAIEAARLAEAQNAAAAATRSHTAALHGQVTEVQATSAAIRVFEGSSALRAVERFIATTLGIGPALQLIFPLVGAAAFGEMIAKIAREITEFFERASQGSERARGEFRELNNQLAIEVDTIQLANDKLDNQIAKLTGKHQNAIKEMIDEAALAVDQLSAKLDSALGKLVDLIKKEEVGFFEALTTGQGVTNPGATAGMGLFGPQQPGTSQRLGGASGLGGAREDIDKIKDRARAEIDAAQKAGDLQRANNAMLKARNDLSISYAVLILQQEDEVKKLQALQDRGFADEQKNLEVARRTLRDLINEQKLSSAEFANANKKQTVTGLQANKSNFDAAKKAAEDWLSFQREQLAFEKSQDAVSLSQELDFWQQRLLIAQTLGPAYVDVVRKLTVEVGNLFQRSLKESAAIGAREAEAMFKSIEESIKGEAEGARETGGHPAAGKLAALQGLSNTPGLNPEILNKIRSQIPAAQREADAEALSELKRFVSESDQAWLESEERSTQAVLQRAQATRAALEALRPFFIGIDSLIDQQTSRIIAAQKKAAEETQRAGAIGRAGGIDGAEAASAQRKLEIETAYANMAARSLTDQIAYTRALAAEDVKVLQAKLATAEIAHEEALDAEDTVKIAETSRQVQQARRAIQQAINKEVAEEKRLRAENSFGFNAAKGVNQAIQQFGQGAANSFSDALINSGKIGTAFKQALNQLEVGALSAVLGAAFKKALAVSGIETLVAKIFGAGGQAALAGALTANATATTANATATITNATASVALATSNAALVAASAVSDGLTVAGTAAMIAMTAALAANTVALYVESATNLFGFADGGRPPIGVPSIIGENGPELFIPDAAGTIIPNSDLSSWMQTPSVAMAGGGGSASSMSTVNNHNVGSVGDMHFHINDTRNPRENVRQISRFLKQVLPNASPFNIK